LQGRPWAALLFPKAAKPANLVVDDEILRFDICHKTPIQV
jgi:hypothetical protein